MSIIPISAGGSGALTVNATANGSISEGDFVCRSASGTVKAGYGLDPRPVLSTDDCTGYVLEVPEFNCLAVLGLTASNTYPHLYLIDHSWNLLTSVAFPTTGTPTTSFSGTARGFGVAFDPETSTGVVLFSGNNTNATVLWHFHITAADAATTTKWSGFTQPATNGGIDATTIVNVDATKAVMMVGSGTNTLAGCVTWDDSGPTAQGSWITAFTDHTAGLGAVADTANDRVFITKFGQPGGSRDMTCNFVRVTSGTTLAAGTQVADLNGGSEEYRIVHAPIYDSANDIYFLLTDSNSTGKFAVKAFSYNSGSPASSGSFAQHPTYGFALAGDACSGYYAAGALPYAFGWYPAADSMVLIPITPQSDTSTPTFGTVTNVGSFADFPGLVSRPVFPTHQSSDCMRSIAAYGGRGAYAVKMSGINTIVLGTLDFDALVLTGDVSTFAGIAENPALDSESVSITLGTVETGDEYTGFDAGDVLYVDASGSISTSDSGVIFGAALDASSVVSTGGGKSFAQLKSEE